MGRDPQRAKRAQDDPTEPGRQLEVGAELRRAIAGQPNNGDATGGELVGTSRTLCVKRRTERIKRDHQVLRDVHCFHATPTPYGSRIILWAAL